MDEADFGLRWDSGSSGPRTAWEQEDGSFPGDLARSWMEAMTRPADFFSSLDPTVPFARPLIFYLVLSILGSAAVAVSGFASPAEVLEAVPGGRTGLMLNFFLSPFVALVTLLIGTGLVHAGVRIFVADAKPIGVTARIICYAAAPSVFAIVPWVGGLISGIWILVFQVLGVKYAHGTSGGRATAAVLTPLLVFFIGLVTLFVMVGVFLALAIGAA